jgi:S-adenosylmethionine:tRNA ribosyltransferase-isomerase
LKTSDFDYVLPPERIAQRPVEPRDSSRLLVLHRKSGEIEHRAFRDIVDYLEPTDLLVINRSRVVPARLHVRKIPSGGKAELLLLERIDDTRWKTLVGGKGLGAGKRVELSNGKCATIQEQIEGAQHVVAFDESLDADLDRIGSVPLPPYIREPLANPERYQTIYAREGGSAAAPTAGLHFTPELMDQIKGKGTRFAEITLHIGLDTFAPVKEADPSEHHIHSEWAELTAETAKAVNETRAKGGRVIAVGTTSVRVLETAGQTATDEEFSRYVGQTRLYILPGFEFKAVDVMLTNFHLPQSTLLMLVSAFAGRELILSTYEKAIAEGYRFFSFGDAMLII